MNFSSSHRAQTTKTWIWAKSGVLPIPERAPKSVQSRTFLHTFCAKSAVVHTFRRSPDPPTLAFFHFLVFFFIFRFPLLFCAFFLPLGVLRREKPLLFSGFPLLFFQKTMGWRVREPCVTDVLCNGEIIIPNHKKCVYNNFGPHRNSNSSETITVIQKPENHPNFEKQKNALGVKRPFSEQRSEFRGILGAILGMALTTEFLWKPYSRLSERLSELVRRQNFSPDLGGLFSKIRIEFEFINQEHFSRMCIRI